MNNVLIGVQVAGSLQVAAETVHVESAKDDFLNLRARYQPQYILQ